MVVIMTADLRYVAVAIASISIYQYHYVYLVLVVVVVVVVASTSSLLLLLLLLLARLVYSTNRFTIDPLLLSILRTSLLLRCR